MCVLPLSLAAPAPPQPQPRGRSGTRAARGVLRLCACLQLCRCLASTPRHASVDAQRTASDNVNFLICACYVEEFHIFALFLTYMHTHTRGRDLL